MKSHPPTPSASLPRSPSLPANTAPRVLITAGPTHEPIDAVRYIGNRSSGRMGVALAEAAVQRQWPVTLLLGPVAIDPPQHSQMMVERFQTAADLHALLQRQWPSHDLLLMAAAVADYRVAEVRDQRSEVGGQKIKRGEGGLTLDLVPTPDLLASLGPVTRSHQMVVGFALEPAASLEAEAKRKLQSKRLDAIVANPLGTMDAADVTAALLWADGRRIDAPPAMRKEAFAEWLLGQIEPAFRKTQQSR